MSYINCNEVKFQPKRLFTLKTFLIFICRFKERNFQPKVNIYSIFDHYRIKKKTDSDITIIINQS